MFFLNLIILEGEQKLERSQKYLIIVCMSRILLVHTCEVKKPKKSLIYLSLQETYQIRFIKSSIKLFILLSRRGEDQTKRNNAN